ncbi:hypothetical protein PI125_g24662 [Phytophthora idaei]|nr:hypothetical protein PI125_g24662 [Phytophthora idaei]
MDLLIVLRRVKEVVRLKELRPATETVLDTKIRLCW